MELVHVSRDPAARLTLGASLRAARLARNITLEEVAAHTKINPGFFRDLECDDLSKWPSNQFYRESYLRAYAEAVGLDAAEVIDAFRRDLAPAAISGPTATATRRRLTPVTIPIIIAVTFVAVYSLGRWTRQVEDDRAREVTAPVVAPVTLVESSSPSPNQVPAAEPEPAPPPPDPPAPIDLDQIEGELLITSNPSGAHVVVNGIGRGPTPARVQFLPPGPYTVRLLLTGYSSVIRNAEISPKRLRVHVSATLEPAPPRPRLVPESSPVPADLDGEESEQNESDPPATAGPP